MKATFSMKGAMMTLVAAVVVWTAPIVHGQAEGRKAAIKIELNGVVKTGSSYYELYANSADSGYIQLDKEESYLWSDVAISHNLRVAPGVSYALALQEAGTPENDPYGTNPGAQVELNVKLPPGYVLYLDDDGNGTPDTPVMTLSFAKFFHLGGASVCYYQLVETRTLAPATAGQLTRLSVGDLIFEVGMGSMANGKSAGRLQLRSEGWNGATPGFSSALPGLLRLVGAPGLNIVAQTITGGTKWETGQVKAELLTASGVSTLSFYAGNNAGSYNSTAFASYTFEKITTGQPSNAPADSDCIKITEIQGSISIVRYVFRGNTSSADTWAISTGTGSDLALEEHSFATNGSGDDEETITVKNSGSTIVAKSRQTWHPYDVTELLTKSEVWSDVAGSADLVTSYEHYLAGTPGAGNLAKLKKVTYPNGATKEYAYYDGADKLGQINTVTEPWSSGTNTSSKVTTYTYTGPTNAPVKEYVDTETVTIGSTQVAQTTYVYDFTLTSPESEPLVKKPRQPSMRPPAPHSRRNRSPTVNTRTPILPIVLIRSKARMANSMCIATSEARIPAARLPLDWVTLPAH